MDDKHSMAYERWLERFADALAKKQGIDLDSQVKYYYIQYREGVSPEQVVAGLKEGKK